MLNNEDYNIFSDNKTTSLGKINDFNSLLEKWIDNDFIFNCGNEWIIEESNLKIYLITWIISFVIISALITLYYHLKKD